VARIRTIKPEFFTSADICGLPPLARLLYIALWCEADREGRLVWSPRTFKIRYLPEDTCQIDKLCELLVSAGLVLTYDADGQTLGFIPSFAAHQAVNNRESESRLTPPPEDLTRQARVRHASGTRDDAAKGKGREGKGTEGKGSLTTIDESWTMPADWITEAEGKKPGTDWKAESERFKSHHIAKATKFASWKQAWWTWVNSPYQKTAPSPKSGNPSHLQDL
jgi:hypothetical protein